MNKKEFFEQVRDTYFDNLCCDFEDFKNMICSIMPIFGELETKIIEEDNKKIISFRDIDKTDVVITSTDNYIPTDEELDMSSIVLQLTLNNEGTIELVEHGVSFFTPANKELVLFLGSIINKKIKF